MTVLTLTKRQSASAHLNNALQLAARFRHELPHMSDEALVKGAIHTITDMRDLILVALEKME